jgi:predicted nucleic acid-binding protein
VTGRYLVDSSAIRRMVHPPAAQRVAGLAADGLAATCAVVDLQLYAALPDADTLAQVDRLRSMTFLWLSTVDADLRRALQLQAELLAVGLRPAWAALTVAALAERVGVVVLHYDTDIDLIAKLTGQPTERLP